VEVNFLSDESVVLINPRMPQNEKNHALTLLTKFSFLKGHIWIATSGSTTQKWVALSKNAILASAAAVNEHLSANAKDCWINPLHTFHVGGLGIMARAYLSSASVINCTVWEPEQYHRSIIDSHATLSALVPTQLYDLVMRRLQAPPSIRAVVVGGGSLPTTVHTQALALGWPVLVSYGLTECSSQVATVPLEYSNGFSKNLMVLSHVAIDCHKNCIRIKSDALLTGYAIEKEGNWNFIDPKVEGWFQTEDRGEIVGGYLQVHGRGSHFIKIGGESVDLLRLENILIEAKLAVKYEGDAAIIEKADERLGYVINLVATNQETDNLVSYFHERVYPFERIRGVHLVSEIPRTPTGKLIKPAIPSFQ